MFSVKSMAAQVGAARYFLKSNSLITNLLANFAGKAWAAGLGLLCVPIYVRFLGIEAYGLIGFFTTLTLLVTAFDMGLSTTLNRELARIAARTDEQGDSHDLLFSMELIYWTFALLVAAMVALLAPWLATQWLNPQALEPGVAVHSIVLLALAGLLLWPQALYGGGLMGTQNQVAYNSVQIVSATVRVLGAIAVLAWISPTITAFFSWQIAVSLAQTAALASILHRSLYRGKWPRFRLQALRGVGHFAAGASGISLSVLCLTTLDKVLLSRLLSLADFGYYMLASALANGVSLVVMPIFQAVFPKLSALVEARDFQRLTAAYHKYCQLMSVLLAPLAFVLVVYSQSILLAWSHDEIVADRTALLLSILSLGNALNGLMNVPYSLMLAQGWTKWIAAQTLCLSAIAAPVLIWAVPKFGALPAAVLWVAVNTIMIFTLTIPHHLQFMPGQIRKWFVDDTVVPIAVSVVVSSTGYLLLWLASPWGSPVLVLLVAGLFALCSCVAACFWVRSLRPRVIAKDWSR